MPEKQTNPVQLKSASLVQEAVAFAKESNAEGLGRVAAQADLRPDREQLEWAIMDALLMEGHLRFAIDLTGRARVFEWIDQRAYRLATNHKLLDQWGWDVPKDAALTAHYLGLIFEALESRKVQLLLGVSGYSSSPNRKLHELLQRNPAQWQALSPIWLGQTGSSTRKAATALGWTPLHFPEMGARHAHRPDASAWIKLFNYPYSQAMLGCTQAALVGTLDRLGIPTVFTIADSADPQDAALASAIVEASPMPLGIRLQWRGQNVEYEHAKHASLLAIVRTHRDLDLMDHLVSSLYLGNVSGMSEPESFALPSL